MKKHPHDTPMTVCMRLGYRVIPEYKRGNWYINVYRNGKLIREGTKSVGKGNILTGKLWQKSINQAYQHYYDKNNN